MRLGLNAAAHTITGSPTHKGLLAMTRDLFAYAADNRASIVYQATNTINGKRYIGITRQDLRKRQAQHLHDAHSGSHGCLIFYRAIRRYGWDAFTWNVLDRCATYQEAARREIELIALVQPEYNSSAGGDGVEGVGHRHSLGARQKMRIAKLGRPGPWTGKKRSAESIAKRTATRALNPVRPWLEKKRDAATKEKIAVKRRKWVICLDDGVLYHGLRAAGMAYDIPRHREIAHVCAGRAKTINGLRFKYTEPPR